MASLKLGKLPDRTPSKITITVSADLNQALNDYAVLYRQTYGDSETVAELIPFMLVGYRRRSGLFQGQKGRPAQCRRAGEATTVVSSNRHQIA